MEVKSEIMEELWRIKEELSSGYENFHEYFQDLLKYQAERHPELTKVGIKEAVAQLDARQKCHNLPKLSISDGGEWGARRIGKEYNGCVLRVDCMCMLDEIMAKRDEIYAIARAHKAEKLWVFGSCARKKEAVAI